MWAHQIVMQIIPTHPSGTRSIFSPPRGEQNTIRGGGLLHIGLLHLHETGHCSEKKRKEVKARRITKIGRKQNWKEPDEERKQTRQESKEGRRLGKERSKEGRLSRGGFYQLDTNHSKGENRGY